MTGSFQLGFQVTPLTEDGNLDTSGDFKLGPHPLSDDPIYKMVVESREAGNRRVGEGRYEEAVANYSDVIMKSRTLEKESDILWGTEGHRKVFELRATAYLNLSLCFLKLEQWTNASNTATRAMQGDKDPADLKEDVLPNEKKAKALYRRAQAQCEGFGNFEKALDDPRAAKELTPDDKAIEQMMRKADIAVKKTNQAADKKLSGFLKNNKDVQDGEGLFDDSLRPSNEKPKQKRPTEPMKMSDGLWVMPQGEDCQQQERQRSSEKTSNEIGPSGIDYEEVGREILGMREDNPAMYAEMRDKVKEMLEQEAEMVQLEERDKLAEKMTATLTGVDSKSDNTLDEVVPHDDLVKTTTK